MCTPIGAIAKFAAAGKRVRKKDLGLIASTYGYVYAAQIAMGANDAQCLKAIREAEAYDGPSIIIAYAPCINHGIKAGMGKAQAEEKAAVACGYWPRLLQQAIATLSPMEQRLFRMRHELGMDAQHPAHRIGYITFSRAVGSHHGGDARAEFQGGAFRKGFEPEGCH